MALRHIVTEGDDILRKNCRPVTEVTDRIRMTLADMLETMRTEMGVGIAACLTTMDCIGAKIVDDDYCKYGIRREGIINSLGGVMNRLNGLYTSLAFYVASSAFGFVNGDDPGPNPGFAARILLCVFPFAAMVIASVITFFLHFPADETASSENG